MLARKHLRTVSEAIDAGASMREALAGTDEYFPELFHQLTYVGDQTGHLDEALAQLAAHYEFQLKLRRSFLTSMAWPLIELGTSIVVIGVLIFALGIIESMKGQTIDALGYGLVGTPGLIKYFTFLALVAGGIFAVWWESNVASPGRNQSNVS